MKAFTGQAVLHIDDHEAHVSISLNPKDGVFEAEFLTSAIPEDTFQNNDGQAQPARLTNILIPLPTGTLECDELNNLYLGGSNGVNRNVSETPISQALNLADDRSGMRLITLESKELLIQFVHNPALRSISELYFLNNFVKLIPLSVEVNGDILEFFPRNSSLSVTSENDLRPILPRISEAWSVIQGAYVFHCASYNENGDIDLSVRRPRAYYKGNSLYRGWEDFSDFLTALIQSFVSKSEDEFSGWKKAITFYLEGRNEELDYDVRIIGFMIFIEMFDGASTMSKQAISNTFNCSMEFADFIVRMRNKLIHKRMTLWNAVPIVHSEILEHQAEWTCSEIAFSSDHYETASILFFIHLERLVNQYIVDHIGYSGPFDDKAEIITDLSARMTE